MGAEAPVKSQRREETLAFELIPLPRQQTPDSEFYALGRLLLKKKLKIMKSAGPVLSEILTVA